MLDVALTGTGGMMPLPNRFLSSMLVRVNGSLMLTDCGEGAQVTLKLLGWGFKSLDVICFTHFHADHISGLPGLLLTVGNAGRTEPMRLYGPPGLTHVVKSLCVIAPELPFPIQCHEWTPRRENRVEFGDLILKAYPLEHRMPCFGYSLTLTRRGRFDIDRARAAEIPMQIWSKLQKQIDADIVYDGKRYVSDMVMGPPRRGITVAYCTDTRPAPGMADFVRGADLFICEGLHGDDREKAALHMHMSFEEAAVIAREAEVGELWLTHFSPAMPDPYNYLQTATDIFPKTVVGRDRMTKTLRFKDV